MQGHATIHLWREREKMAIVLAWCGLVHRQRRNIKIILLFNPLKCMNAKFTSLSTHKQYWCEPQKENDISLQNLIYSLGLRLIRSDIYIAQPHLGMAAFVQKRCWLPLPTHQLNHFHNMRVDHGIYVMRDSKQITECLFAHSGSWSMADILSTVVHKGLAGLAALTKPHPCCQLQSK
jgi:hypothetical protein